MKIKINFLAILSFFVLLITFSSCVSVSIDYYDSEEYTDSAPSLSSNKIGKKIKLSRKIYSKGKRNAYELTSFFMRKCPSANQSEILRLATLYVIEGNMEGINSDVAFVQMCLETNYLRFGNLVSPEMHNYCGLGAIDQNRRGESFATEQLGVRAHIQHLHAYGTKENVQLKNTLIDNRYKYVKPRGKAPTVFALAGTWAADKQYGVKLDKLLTELGNA